MPVFFLCVCVCCCFPEHLSALAYGGGQELNLRPLSHWHETLLHNHYAISQAHFCFLKNSSWKPQLARKVHWELKEWEWENKDLWTRGREGEIQTWIHESSKIEVSADFSPPTPNNSWCNGKRAGLVIRTLSLCHFRGVPSNCLMGLSFLISWASGFELDALQGPFLH